MKPMITFCVFILLIALSEAITCSICGHMDCCPSEPCSIHCKQLGRAGGSCKFSSQEDRCICYCYRSVEFLERAENLTESTSLSDGAGCMTVSCIAGGGAICCPDGKAAICVCYNGYPNCFCRG
jgi:hypothetical protein